MNRIRHIFTYTILIIVFTFSLQGQNSSVKIENRFLRNNSPLITGSTTKIKWSEKNMPVKITLQLLQNNLVCGTIATDVPAASGIYRWKTGQLTGYSLEKGQKFSIKIVGFEDSTEEFSIAPGQFLELQNYSKEIPSGNIVPIKWSSALLSGSLKIYLKNRNDHAETITLDAPVEKGFFLWDTSKVRFKDLKPGQYRLAVEDSSGNFSSETELFTISESNSVSITSPAYGNSFHAGDKIPVTWRSSEEFPVKIDLLKGNSVKKVLGRQIGSGRQYFLWNSGNISPGTGYRIRLTLRNHKIALSPEFTIYPTRKISVMPLPPVAPYHQDFKIIWTSTGLKGTINIELLKKNKHLGWIARKVDINSDYHIWKTGKLMEEDPVTSGRELAIRISSNESDASDTTLPFRISKTTYLNITSPVSTTTWASSHNRKITWETNSSFPVEISLISDKGEKIVLKRSYPSLKKSYILSKKTIRRRGIEGNFRISITSKEKNFVTISRNKVLITPVLNDYKKLFTDRISYNKCWQEIALTLEERKNKKTKKKAKKRRSRKVTAPKLTTIEIIANILKKHSKKTGNSKYSDYLAALSMDLKQNCLNCITGTTFNIPPGTPEIILRKRADNSISLTVFRRHPGSDIRFKSFTSSFTDIQNILPFEKDTSVPFSKEIFPVYTADIIYSSHPVSSTAVLISGNRAGEDSSTPEIIIYRDIAEKIFKKAIKPLAARCFHSSLSNMVTLDNFIDLIALQRISHFTGPLPVYYDEEEKNLKSVTLRSGAKLFYLERLKSAIASYLAIPVLIRNRALQPEDLYGMRVVWLTSLLKTLRSKEAVSDPIINPDLSLILSMEKREILTPDSSSTILDIDFAALDSFLKSALSSVFSQLSSKEPANPVPAYSDTRQLKIYINSITGIPGHLNFNYSIKKR